MKYTQGLYHITKKETLGKNLYRISIYCPEISSIAKPGQFIHILPVGHTLRRPISICDIEKDSLKIVFEVKGEGTSKIADLRKGDLIDMMGPLGHGFTLLPEAKNIICIGGGIGTPPMLPVLKYYSPFADNITIISGFRSAEFVILQNEFEKYSTNCILCTDNGTAGQKAIVTEPLKNIISNQKIDAIYACGPTPMLKAIAQIANENDIFCEISLEERMGCGIGACLVCACKLQKEGKEIAGHVCKDGPVFSSKEVQW